jgi:uncharacterized membrane protein
MTFWKGVLWLHLLAMAFFVGGQMMLGAVVVPVLRSDSERMRGAALRFGIGSGVALAVLIVTGASMAAHLHKWHASSLQVKMGLVVVLVALIFAHMRRPRSPILDALTFGVSVAIVWLGIVVAS